MIVYTVARHTSICYSCVYICYITNDVKAILVKKRERHVLMHALGVLARIQAQSSISISNSNINSSNDCNARD